MAHATANFFWSLPPGVMGRGQKVKYHSIKFQFLNQSQIFVNQTLCVLSQMKDTKHFRGDIRLPGSCPRGDPGGEDLTSSCGV